MILLDKYPPLFQFCQRRGFTANRLPGHGPQRFDPPHPGSRNRHGEPRPPGPRPPARGWGALEDHQETTRRTMAEAYTAYLFACPEGKSSTRGARGRKSKPDGHDDEHQRPGCRAEIGPTWRTAGWRQVEQPGRRITQPPCPLPMDQHDQGNHDHPGGNPRKGGGLAGTPRRQPAAVPPGYAQRTGPERKGAQAKKRTTRTATTPRRQRLQNQLGRTSYHHPNRAVAQGHQAMQETVTTTFKGKELKIMELTVKQVRETFKRITEEEITFIDDLLDKKVPTLIVLECTGLTMEELEESKPSELTFLFDKVAEANPSLASMIQRRVEALDRLSTRNPSAQD